MTFWMKIPTSWSCSIHYCGVYRCGFHIEILRCSTSLFCTSKQKYFVSRICSLYFLFLATGQTSCVLWVFNLVEGRWVPRHGAIVAMVIRADCYTYKIYQNIVLKCYIRYLVTFIENPYSSFLWLHFAIFTQLLQASHFLRVLRTGEVTADFCRSCFSSYVFF